MRKGLICLAIILLVASTTKTLARESVMWTPDFGDQLYIDLDTNIGYLLHQNGQFGSFPVATGTRRTVNYLGQKYYAATPATHWEVKGLAVQKSKVLFGTTGRFLRLYNEGLSKTLYGIHAHRDFATWSESGNRFKSFGCIIVSEQMLNVLIDTYELNGKQLAVTTSHGASELQETLRLRTSAF